MELKTLKDLDIMKGKVHAIGGEVGVGELKAEAIKWVKECQKCSVNDERLYWAEFIKHFFNLKEEDLR